MNQRVHVLCPRACLHQECSALRRAASKVSAAAPQPAQKVERATVEQAQAKPKHTTETQAPPRSPKAAAGRIGGASVSPAKAAAAKVNGARGGRPRKAGGS